MATKYVKIMYSIRYSIDNFKKWENWQFQYYGNRRLSEIFMGITNFSIMGIEDFVNIFYGNHQLQKKIMEIELWNKKTSKLWI